MGPFIGAWLIGEGIITYRAIKQTHLPPVPGALLATSGIFVLLALVAEFDRARPVATLLAYGFDIAAFMNLAPTITGGTSTTPAGTPAAPKAAAAPVPGSTSTLATAPQSPSG